MQKENLNETIVSQAEKAMYCDTMEDRNEQLLNDFNQHVHWFSEITPNERGSEIDFKCKDIKSGRTTHVETKERKGTIKQYANWGTVLIEPSKIARTSKIMESGYSLDEQRLYINFVDDGVLVFNLNKISTLKYFPNHKHWNNRDKSYENEDRFGLLIEDAIVYQRDEDGNLNKVMIVNR